MRLEQHPLVATLVEDPYAPERRVVLTGFVGRARTDEDVRLYVDLELRSWFEFPDADVVHSSRRGETGDPLAEDVLWLSGETMIVPGRLESNGEIVDYPPVRVEQVQESRLLREPLAFRSDPIGRGDVAANGRSTILGKPRPGKRHG